ncbi:MAG: ATP-binding protein [Syntrophobacter sp.]
MRARSIRTRLTAWYTMLLTVTLLILGGAAYGLLSYSLSNEMDTALNSVATALAERAHGRSAAFPPSEIDQAFRRFFGFSPWEHYFQMRDPWGSRGEHPSLPSTGKLPLGRQALNDVLRGIPAFETVEGLGDYPVRILNMPVIESGRVVNLIQVGMSLQSSNETRFRFLLIMAGVLPLGLVLAGTGGWLLASRALRPVYRMAEAARRIGAEHLGQRIDETGTGDELDNLAKTLNEMLTRLDVAFSQVRRFSADASHELQTPLTIMKGELEVALRSTRTPEDYQATLKSALEEVDRIAHLVEGLLLLARAEAGVLKMDRREVDLMQLVEDVYHRIKPLADAQSVELRLDPAEPVSIQGDGERLRSMVLNLVDNAIKYTGPGGRVILQLRREGDFASILISDNGMGISPGEREQVFEPFYRTSDARALSGKGTGLGLSIARSIAVAHGGAIQMESTPGRGSSFTVRIPILS